MAGSVAHPVAPLSSTDTRPPEPPRFGRERVGRVRPGFHRAVLEELRAAYSADDRPWIVGFSGGKDSTCLTQLLYYMLARLRRARGWDRRPAGQTPVKLKPVYVLASDTRVEVPSISLRIRRELERMGAAADRTGAVVVVLAARKDESDTRAQTMNASATDGQRFRPHADLPDRAGEAA